MNPPVIRPLALAVAAAFLICVPAMPDGGQAPARRQTGAGPRAALYGADSNHIWDRVHRALHVRRAAGGEEYGADEIDPLLWRETTFLLSGPSHARAIQLLDEFLRTNAERLVTDPLKRALFQHDLWAVFDWAASQPEPRGAERRALESRLARIIRRVALPKSQIERLPDSYAEAVKSHAFAEHYDPAHPDHPFLPADFFDAKGSWINVTGSRESSEPLARQHADELSRSTFTVLLRVPGGQAATRGYLKALWEFPRPYVPDGSFSLAKDRELRMTLNPELPDPPAGTTVALVRRMLLIDDAEALVGSNLVESIQLRVYHPSPRSARPALLFFHDDQDFFEFRMRRPQLVGHQSGGLHAVQKDEPGFITFSSQGVDQFEYAGRARVTHGRPTLAGCPQCHSQRGIHSMLTARRLLTPNSFFEGFAAPDNGQIGAWAKARRADWGLMQGLWQSSPQ